MWLFKCRDACWCCKCVENANLNVTVILDLKRPSTGFPTLASRLANISQHCDNVDATIIFWSIYKIGTTITQHFLNVVSMSADVSTYCNKVVAMLEFWLEYHVGTMFTQHCLEIHTMLLGHLKVSTNEWCHNLGDRHWDTVTTLPRHCSVSWVAVSKQNFLWHFDLTSYMTHVRFAC